MSYTPTVWASGDLITSTKLNKLENGLAGVISDTPVISVTGSTPVTELDSNKFYIFEECTSLTLTLATPADNTIVNEYHFRFTSGSTPTTLSLPATVIMPDVFAVVADTIYEISIIDNLGAFATWTAPDGE